MRRFFTFIFYILSFFITLKAQDPFFSQYFLNLVNTNPATVGSSNERRVSLQYRNQWPSLGNAFITYQGSYDQYIKSIHSGIGLNIMRDNIGGGTLTSTNVDLIYSYRTKIRSGFTIQYGLQASFLFRSLNVDNLPVAFNDKLTSSQTSQPDLSIGFLGMSRNSEIGLSINHLNTGVVKFNVGFINDPIKFSVFYSRRIKIYDSDKVQENGFLLIPSFNVNLQGQSIMLNYGAGIEKSNIFAGMWIRNNLIPVQFSTLIFSVGYLFDNLRLGYSYDYSLLSLNNVTPITGAHEVSLILIIPTDPHSKRYGPVNSVNCPKAFVK